jgi:glutamate/tyrosine decarboxylase-like PLP-dependent enzyme
MHIDNHILNQFISPNNSNRQEVENLVHVVTNQLLDFLSNASKKPTNPIIKYCDTAHFQIPEFSQTQNEIQSNLQELYELSMNPANPKYIGHMDSMPTLWSVVGDFIASALNNNVLSLEMSPFITQLEYSLTKQFATLFGLPETAGGVMLSGGTLSNLQALLIARNTKLNIKNGNIFSLKKEPVIFTSEHSHSSIQKIGMMIGIGTENVIKIKTDINSKIDIDDLEIQIKEQIKIGKQPFAVVATAGTTVSGNIDPLTDISKIAKKFDLWFHIDAIYGGAVIFSEKYKHLISGIDQADSISFNPQKWMYVAKTCSMILFRDFDKMVEHFRIAAPYMKEQNAYINLGEINVQGTKYAEVVKLWLSLQSIGKKGYEKLIDYSFYLTEVFEKEIIKRPFLKLTSKPETNILCFRGEPKNIKAENFDNWNENLQQYLVKQTDFFLSLPKYKNDLWLRTVLLNPFLTIEHIKTLFKHIDNYEKTTRPK